MPMTIQTAAHRAAFVMGGGFDGNAGMQSKTWAGDYHANRVWSVDVNWTAVASSNLPNRLTNRSCRA